MELMIVSFCWLIKTSVSMCGTSLKKIAYELVVPSAAMPSISCSSNMDEMAQGFWLLFLLVRGDLSGVMAKVLDCRLEVSEFELQWRCYVHFRTNTLGKA